ncbi:MAG: hypothetical protein IT260_08400 [Saprospiraceae bacterium]|nr:hypothetical protein [Saprospiraceae bacterium]
MKTIDFQEILDAQAAGQQVLCIDVREAYRRASLDAGGWKIPYNRLGRQVELLAPYRDWLTVICCLRPTGSQRTALAVEILQKQGFADVRELKNGLYQGWIQQVGRQVKLPAPAQRVEI